jgi:hypothetical protein
MFSQQHKVTDEKNPLITFLENAMKQSISKDDCQTFLLTVERLSGIPFGDLTLRTSRTIKEKNEILNSAVQLAKNHFTWIHQLLSTSEESAVPKKRKAFDSITKLGKKSKKEEENTEDDDDEVIQLHDDDVKSADETEDEEVIKKKKKDPAGLYYTIQLPGGEKIKVKATTDDDDNMEVEELDMGNPPKGAKWFGKPFETPLGQWTACRNGLIKKYGAKKVLLENICFQQTRSYGKDKDGNPQFYRTNPNLRDTLDMAAVILDHGQLINEEVFKKLCGIPDVLENLKRAVEYGENYQD